MALKVPVCFWSHLNGNGVHLALAAGLIKAVKIQWSSGRPELKQITSEKRMTAPQGWITA